MDLGGFHARVARALGRGTSLDTVIPGYVEEAVQDIEKNYTFQYMRRWVELSIDASSTSPHIISLFTTPIKEITLLRYINPDDSRFRRIKGPIDPGDRQTRETGTPTAFWLDGVSSIVLDAIPDTDLDVEGNFVQYSVWQPDQTTFRHYLIDHYRTLLLSETVQKAAVDLRDARLGPLYQSMNTRAWTNVNTSEEALQKGGDTGSQMDWEPPYDEFDPNFVRNR